jgi:lysozyme
MSWLGRILGHGGDEPLPTPPSPPKLNLPEPLRVIVPDDTGWALDAVGLAFIEANEDLRLKAYLDSAGIPTIGYGTIVVDGVKVKMGDTITPEKAMACLSKDAAAFVFALRQLVKVSQTQNQIDALTSFTYNVGHASFASSTLLKVINARQPIAEDLFTRWNKVHKNGQVVEVPGLTARRKREFQLYRT